jgi:hypothetical protein
MQCYVFINSGFVNTIYKHVINSLLNLFANGLFRILVNFFYFKNKLRAKNIYKHGF